MVKPWAKAIAVIPLRSESVPNHGRGPSADDTEPRCRWTPQEAWRKGGFAFRSPNKNNLRHLARSAPLAPRLRWGDRRVGGRALVPSREAVRSGNPGSRWQVTGGGFKYAAHDYEFSSCLLRQLTHVVPRAPSRARLAGPSQRIRAMKRWFNSERKLLIRGSSAAP